MTDTAAAWRSSLYALVPHPAEPRVWLLPDGAGWTLPAVEHGDYVAPTDPRPLSLAVEARWGLAATALRCAHSWLDREAHAAERVFVLEPAGAAWAPPQGRWIDSAELAQLELARPAHRPIVEAHLREILTGEAPAQRASWARPGWTGSAFGWVADRLAELGLSLVGPLEQVKHWSLSSVWRAPTGRGPLYFKATTPNSPWFVNEGVLLRGLAGLFPDRVPQPLAVDAGRRWMLLPDLGPSLGWEAPRETRLEAWRAYGALQVEAARRVPDLLAIGCLDRRLPVLADQLEPLADFYDECANVSAEDRARLRAALPQLREKCAALARYRVPASLVHGDLHLDNVARPDGRFVFYDWTDACLAHPFLDLIDILGEPDAEIRRQLQEQYLGLWTDYESPERLREMWALAGPLSAAHQAVSYQHLLQGAEPGERPLLDWAMPHWLPKILEAPAPN